MPAWRAARFAVAVTRCFALVGEAFGEYPREPVRGGIGIIGIIAVVLAGEQDVERVVPVVVPLRVEIASEMTRHVAVVFEHEVNMPTPLDGGADLSRHFVEPLRLRNRMHRVEAKTVET